jgi:hypothetical protein
LCPYNRVFGTDEGKMVLDDIMRICGVDTISADLGNQNITYYNEGARAVGIKIKNIINKKYFGFLNQRLWYLHHRFSLYHLKPFYLHQYQILYYMNQSSLHL